MNNEFTLVQQAGLVIASLISKDQDFKEVQIALSMMTEAEKDVAIAKAKLDETSRALHALILKHRGAENGIQLKGTIGNGC